MVLMNLGDVTSHVCQNMSHEVTKVIRPKGQQSRLPGPGSAALSLPGNQRALKYNPQPVVDTALPVTVSQVAQVSYDWDSVELALSIREANELYAKPCALALATQINAEAATFCADNTFNSVGTPGTTPTTTQTYLNAGDLLVAQELAKQRAADLHHQSQDVQQLRFHQPGIVRYNPRSWKRSGQKVR